MAHAKSTLTTLGPGELILDQNLLTQVSNSTVLSPTDILSIATSYKLSNLRLNDDLANRLFLIALKMSRRQSASSNSLSSEQTTATGTTGTPATPPISVDEVVAQDKADPQNEVTDQIEDFLWGYIDAEDKNEGAHPGIRGIENIYWVPFSASMTKIGLLIEEINLDFAGINSAYHIIGFSLDPGSLLKD